MPDGSVIQSQITAANQRSAEYRVILVKGDCVRPPSSGVELGTGETAKSRVDSKHLDMPINALMGGDYAVIVVSSTRSIVACGMILRDG